MAPRGPWCQQCGEPIGADGWQASYGDHFCLFCWTQWLRGEQAQGKASFCSGFGRAQKRSCWCCDDGQGGWEQQKSSWSNTCSTWSSASLNSTWWGDGENNWHAEGSRQWDTGNLTTYDNLDDLSYIDSHCHLECCLQNERFGDEIWTMKKWLCTHWQRGECWYGENCHFAHEEEGVLRLPPLRPRDLEPFASRHPVRPRSSPGPRLGCLVTNCCDGDAIVDTLMLVAAGERMLGGRVFCTFGCHPHMWEDYGDALEARLLAAFAQCGSKAVAWGECGLDYYKNFYDAQKAEIRTRMREVFARQARLAASRDLPLVVHSRDAEEDTLAVLTSSLPCEHPVHVHAFQGSTDFVRAFLRHFPNGVVGISAAVYGIPAVADIVRALPLDRMVLETDAPYLSDEPREVPKIAKAVARIKALGVREVLIATNRNSERLYRLEPRRPAARGR